MRVKPSTSFPHPVLSESTGDYGDRNFRIDLHVVETPAAGGALIKGDMTIDEPSLVAAVESGKAQAGLMITCRDTYLDRFEKCGFGEISLDLSHGQIRGVVYVRGILVAAQDGLHLESENIDAEFPLDARIVKAGDVIALSPEVSFEAGLEKLAPLESIFRLRMSEDVPEGHFQIDLDTEAVEIHASTGLFEVIYNLRQKSMRDLLLPSLYLPVVMSVLEAMKDDGYADKRWYGVMMARCNAEGIDVKRAVDLAGAAQQLLDGPLSVLKTVIEKGG